MIVLKLSLVSGRRTFLEEEMRFIILGERRYFPAPLDTAEEQKMIHMLGTVNEETAKHADREKSTIGCIHSKEI